MKQDTSDVFSSIYWKYQNIQICISASIASMKSVTISQSVRHRASYPTSTTIRQRISLKEVAWMVKSLMTNKGTSYSYWVIGAINTDSNVIIINTQINYRKLNAIVLVMFVSDFVQAINKDMPNCTIS